jgi:vesicle-fusing ATPase
MNILIERTGTDKVGVGIKKVLMAVEEASLDAGNVSGRFAEVIEAQILAAQD